MKVKAFVLAGLVAVLIVPTNAGAATVSIEVRQNEFRPVGIGASLGDDVTWNVTSGTHQLQAYSPAAFDSPVIPAGASFTWTNDTGGDVKYRCTIHSTLEAGVCDGMCGLLSDAPPAVAAPTISTPVDGSTVTSTSVTVSGSAPGPDVDHVRLTDNGALRGLIDVSGGSWSQGFSFAAGLHELRAVSVHGDGFESSPAEITFTVDATDGEPPFVGFISPPNDLTITLSALQVRVLVTDNIGIASLTVRARNLITGAVAEIDTECEPECTETRWVANGSRALGTGIFEVSAQAEDDAGNIGGASITVIAVR